MEITTVTAALSAVENAIDIAKSVMNSGASLGTFVLTENGNQVSVHRRVPWITRQINSGRKSRRAFFVPGYLQHYVSRKRR